MCDQRDDKFERYDELIEHSRHVHHHVILRCHDWCKEFIQRKLGSIMSGTKMKKREIVAGTPSQGVLESTCEILVMVIFDLDHAEDLLKKYLLKG